MIYRNWHHLPYADPRSTDRVTLPAAESLVVEVEWEGRIVPANLVDLSAKGVGLHTAQSLEEQLPVGAIVMVRIAHPIDGWQVETSAEVRNLGMTGDEHQHVGLRFVNEGNLFTQLESALGRYFNRRKGGRTAASADEQTFVTVRWNDDQAEGRVYDLSPTGTGVWFPAGTQWTPAVDDQVQLSIALDEDPTWSVEARVARVNVSGDRTFVGFAFGDMTREHHLALRTWIEDRADCISTFERGLTA